jgi:hypothetical protein
MHTCQPAVLPLRLQRAQLPKARHRRIYRLSLTRLHASKPRRPPLLCWKLKLCSVLVVAVVVVVAAAAAAAATVAVVQPQSTVLTAPWALLLHQQQQQQRQQQQ